MCNTTALVSRDIKVWRTIELGKAIKDAHGYRNAISEAGMEASFSAYDVMNRSNFTVARRRHRVALVIVSVRELGFEVGADREDIFSSAQNRRLRVCPSEVGPLLRLQYNRQPRLDELLIGMEPITTSDGEQNSFSLIHDEGGLLLGTYFGRRGHFWLAEDRFVFVLARR